MCGRLKAARLAFMVCTACSAFASLGAVVFVDKDNTSGFEDGFTWPTAFTTIQAAIDAVYSGGGGEVWVAEGIYDEPRTALFDQNPLPDQELWFNLGSIMLPDGVELLGGFAGGESRKDERDWEANETTLDGSVARDGESAFHVIKMTGEAIVDGFTITGGNACGGHDSGASGGILGARGTVSNCKFIGNRACGGPGALGGRVTLINCEFAGNQSNDGDGAVSMGGVVQGCVFRDNAGSEAGALGVSRAITVSNCVFINNEGRREGGALSVQDVHYLGLTTQIIENCVFAHNRVLGTSGDQGYGGAIEFQSSEARVDNCLFYGNSAENAGAAVAAWGYANDDGEILTGPVTFTNCTFSGNSAPEGRGGVSYYPVAVFRNCILWDNIGGELVPPPTYWIYEVEYSLVKGGTEGPGNIDSNPLFVDTVNEDFRLQAGSPAIDTGTLEGAPATDIRGVPRPQGAGVDMGAYEYQAGDEADVDGSGTTDAVDVQLVINGALGLDSRAGLDVDGNGVIDAIDVQMVINWALGVG
ncbi:MAG: right-handed parallel beta-helix repeat-containing protein [Candidatus Hydrogenedentes bacterium]|nr:right-handed parallel beta-helix repeat-containing protein [Candidatus Hydrogenedentota bacterium]